jgi:hypothetical protein
MDLTDARHRAVQIWGRRMRGATVVKCRNVSVWGIREPSWFDAATGRWVDGLLHVLDDQGHACCHAMCSRLEAQADMPPGKEDGYGGERRKV